MVFPALAPALLVVRIGGSPSPVLPAPSAKLRNPATFG